MTYPDISFQSDDIQQFKLGEHHQLFAKFGAHLTTNEKQEGCWFSIWVPDVDSVSVIGDFNQWQKKMHPLKQIDVESGVWEGFIPGVKPGDEYLYCIQTRDKEIVKTDPFGFSHTLPPTTHSIVCDLSYTWNDQTWLKQRKNYSPANEPVSIYELHIGSWKRSNGNFLNYREIAETLPGYVRDMGFTHVEFLPVTEHPYYGSWGYQPLGFFAPSSRYGTPQDFMYLVDQIHQHGIGVILDWVPSHFACDEHGLINFNGDLQFETNERHPDWKTCIFNVGKHEVVDFLISSALFWIEHYHVDGLRVDAVASMLYLNYSRREGEWDPNFFGGEENLDSIAFLRRLNHVVNDRCPDVQLIAEESSAWKGVSRSMQEGGLDFDMKLNLGWMHDTLTYFQQEDKNRDDHLKQLVFSLYYAFDEDFVLPLSHDEVVHGKSSLLGKMSGSDTEKFANLRALYAYMYAHPGKKLLFMGSEIAAWDEWNHEQSLPWEFLQYERHLGVQTLVRDLNQLYRDERALHSQDFTPSGFTWIDGQGENSGVISFLRNGVVENEKVVVVCNFRLNRHDAFNIKVPPSSAWREVLNTDDQKYDGGGFVNANPLAVYRDEHTAQSDHITIKLAPLSVVYLKKYDE